MINRLWQITEYPFQPDKLRHFETIFAIGNGYLSARAACEEGHDGETPATLVHGVFNHAPGMTVPELAIAPNWLQLRLVVDGTAFSMKTDACDYLRPTGGVMLGYRRTLHMDTASLRREVLFRAESGSTVRLEFERFASLDQPHILGQRLRISALDGAPTVRIEAAFDRRESHSSGHWRKVSAAAGADQMSLSAATSQSGYRIALACRLIALACVEAGADEQGATLATTLQLQGGSSAIVDKLTAIYTSRDVEDPLQSATAALKDAAADAYDALYEQHCRRWREAWDSCDIKIEGDDSAQLALRFAFVLTAIPIVTAPAGFAGLVKLSDAALRDERADLNTFWQGARENLARGTLLGLITLAVLVVNATNLSAYAEPSAIGALRNAALMFLLNPVYTLFNLAGIVALAGLSIALPPFALLLAFSFSAIVSTAAARDRLAAAGHHTS